MFVIRILVLGWRYYGELVTKAMKAGVYIVVIALTKVDSYSATVGS